MSAKKETVSKAATSETANGNVVKDKINNTREEGKKEEYICWPDRKPQKDWTGRKHGRLTFIQPVAWRRNCSGGVWYYLCECTCGGDGAVETIIPANKVTQSCGCLHKEASRVSNAARKATKYNKTKASEAARITATRSGAPRPQIPSKTPYGACFHRGYECDKMDGRKAGEWCYGDRCYVNERLGIGIF